MADKELTYEQAIERLEQITSKLNESDTSLDEALSLFEEGTRLTALCTKKLESVKQKIVEIEKG
jgi:exodeoxyribonuclease VII small subunit